MGKSSNNAPSFDPYAAARAQAETNRLSMFLPTGDLRYGTVGSGGQFVPESGGAALRVIETPGAAQFRQFYEQTGLNLAERGQNISGNLPDIPTYGNLPAHQYQIDYSQVSPVARPEDFAAQGEEVEQATFGRAMGLLDPVFERQTRDFENQMVNRGIPTGTEDYSTSYRDLADAQNEARVRAAYDAVGAGRAYQQALFGMAGEARGQQLTDQLTSMALQNQARQTGYGERASEYQNVLNTLAQMMSGPQIQAAVPLSQTPVDVMGAMQTAYGGDLAGYRAEQQLNQAALGGLYGMGGALAGGWARAGFPGIG